MMDPGLAIVLTAVLISIACALPGAFLVLRKMAMMADAISHAILPGIVAGYFLARGPNLLAGFVGAAAAAVITASLIEALANTRKMAGESAIGLVFPAMFALGTFLVSRYFANVHLDADAVLYGNIEFVGFENLLVMGVNLGPQALWVMAALCIVNLLFVGLLFKELKLATFDPGLAAALGFSPALLHHLLMAVTSVTAVGAFVAVGAVLVVALMIIPAATAYLLTDDLRRMVVIACLVGALGAVLGYGVARAINASVSGAMVTVLGVQFLLVVLFSPAHGLVARARRLRQQRVQFALQSLLVHLLHHEAQAGEEHEAEVRHLSTELRWTRAFAEHIVGAALSRNYVTCQDGRLSLTGDGRRLASRLTGSHPPEGNDAMPR